jgi:D-alanyl-D-alanine carboxypeptidase/D-alanyl-D-alanine-endopeptidase (penicillin-binding protein 4)
VVSPRPATSPRAASASPFLPPQALSGWALRDAAGDSLLESNRAEANLTPGSTQKLFTTWITLDVLGGDRTFATELYRAGPVEGGILKGDLLIKGGGDPAFAGSQLDTAYSAARIFALWTAALNAAGIRRVEGCVVGDGSYLIEEGPHPAGLWEDAGNYYAGTVSGLCFNDNLYALNFTGASAPGKPLALLGPSPLHVGITRFDNRLLSGPAGSRDSAYILGGFPSGARALRGTFPAGRSTFFIKGSLPNPAWTAARELRDYLAVHGIAFPAETDPRACGDSLALPNHAPIDYAKATLIAKQASPPLKELIRHTNQKSDNNYAAQLLALLGKASGKSPDWRGGLEALYAWLDARGFSREEIHLKDGNGLSRYNWISPAQTSRLLSLAYKQKAFPDFQASLVGAPGSEGKLLRYGSGWEGRLYVKTGTLEGVSALAGYLRAKSGRWLAFAVSANNFDADGDGQKAFIPLLKHWAAKY